jgi:hypothetical protein
MSFPDSFVKVPFARRWINRDLITMIQTGESAGEPRMRIYFAANDSIEFCGADSVSQMRAALGLKDTPERVK